MTVRPRGPVPAWHAHTPRQRAILADVLEQYRIHEHDGTYPRGPRGIFYDLRPNGHGNGMRYTKNTPKGRLPEGLAGPKQVGEVITMARRAGLIPERLIADSRSPAPDVPFYTEESVDSVVTGTVEAVRTVVEDTARRYTLDPQTGQPVYIEAWCEAGELIERTARLANPLGVPVYSGGGYDSIKIKRRTAERIAAHGRPTVILHIGDLDDYGEMIFTAFAEDVIAWAETPIEDGGYGGGAGVLTIERLALTRAQVELWGLAEDEEGKVEADIIPVARLDELIRDAIDARHDPAIRDAVAQREADDRDEIRRRLGEALAA